MSGVAARAGPPGHRRAGAADVVDMVVVRAPRRPTPDATRRRAVRRRGARRRRPGRGARRDAGRGGGAAGARARGAMSTPTPRDPAPAPAARRPRAAGAGDRTLDDQRRRRHPARPDARGREDHRSHRRHADRAAAFVRARHARRRDLGQVRVLQPGRLGQGPRRLPDDPRRDPRRAAGPGQDDHRLDQRQHRRRVFGDRRRAGLPGDAGDAGQRVVGAAQDHRGVRHQADLLGPDGGLGRRHPPVPQDRRREPGDVLLPGPVFEPVEPARALHHHRARDLGADRGARHPLRHRHRHHRHGDGHGPPAEGVPARHRDLRGRAGGRAARPRGPQAHGQLAGAAHLPARGARRRVADGHRRGVGHLRAARQGGRDAGRAFVGRVAGGRRAHRQAPRRRGQAGRDRDAVPRSRRALLRGAAGTEDKQRSKQRQAE